MRIRITKNYKDFRKGDIKDVSPNEAFDLIDRGVAIVSKDMTERDMAQKGKKWRRS